MQRNTLIASGAIALAAAIGFFALRSSPPSPAESAKAPAETPRKATGGEATALSAPASQPDGAESARAARTTADEVEIDLSGVAGVRGKLLPMREATPLEKQSVRELVKLHVPEPEGGIADTVPGVPQGYDQDSLMLKYGSYDVRQLQEAHASVRAILDWQGNGPFTEKSAELLPGDLLRGMEIEREWLEQTILYP
jgi:hypothetical protein